MTERDWQKYVKVKPVWAKQMDEDFVVETPEGAIAASAGDYLVMDEHKTHSWPVRRDVFERTYMPWDGQENCLEWAEAAREAIEELIPMLKGFIDRNRLWPSQIGWQCAAYVMLQKLRSLVGWPPENDPEVIYDV